MGDTEEQRQASIEKLRSHSLGRLLQIFEQLEAMNLSVQEIEDVLKTCGLNEECALRFATYIADEKEKNFNRWQLPQHP